jgi:hypothetical protein
LTGRTSCDERPRAFAHTPISSLVRSIGRYRSTDRPIRGSSATPRRCHGPGDPATPPPRTSSSSTRQ